MKQFKHVDSLNTKKQVRHIKAVNWYCRGLAEKFDNIGKESILELVKTDVELCQKEMKM